MGVLFSVVIRFVGRLVLRFAACIPVLIIFRIFFVFFSFDTGHSAPAMHVVPSFKVNAL